MKLNGETRKPQTSSWTVCRRFAGLDSWWKRIHHAFFLLKIIRWVIGGLQSFLLTTVLSEATVHSYESIIFGGGSGVMSTTLCSRCSEAKGNYLTPTGLLPLLLVFLSAHLQTSSSSFPVYNLGSSPRQKQQQERRRKKKNRKREEEEEERMGSKVLKAESVLRILSLVFAAMAALLVGLDTQTKAVFFVTRTATVKDMDALWVMTVVFSVVAGYHLLHLFRCMAFTWLGKNPCHCNKFVAWLYFVLDQGSTYATFGATMAALQVALVGLFGIGSLQWSKLCNIYTRFCDQIAGGIICGLVATLVMAVVSAISAHRLFQLYPRTRRSSPKSAGGGRQWLLF